jgi:hypothetical protein
MIKITFIRYNNKDFQGIVFAETEKQAEIIIDGLKQLKHISNIKSEVIS